MAIISTAGHKDSGNSVCQATNSGFAILCISDQCYDPRKNSLAANMACLEQEAATFIERAADNRVTRFAQNR